MQNYKSIKDTTYSSSLQYEIPATTTATRYYNSY
ncbi:hypothetical protein BVRB_3g059410 [Beta vulgaris subsp. vulgaris]|nr:hypothetical protein BVRB_3g059410 [Beta vulgaris subsp. vulgaris]